MARFFVAVCLPEQAKNCLLAVQPAVVAGMRLVEPQDLHLTLHFLGDIPTEKGAALRQALANVKAKAFAIALKGTGRFPPEGQPKVVWAGIESSPDLAALHRSVGTALTDAIGFRPEVRPYSPHVTLAYLNVTPPPGAIEQHVEENQAFHVPDVFVSQFALFSTVVINDVPKYESEAVFPLLL